MHYYKRDIGEYAKKAGKLTMLQHGACTLLIDACHNLERFPTLDEAIDWAWASSEAEIDAVKFVLKKLFVLQGDGTYLHEDTQARLKKYHANAGINQAIAIERESKKREAKLLMESTLRGQTVNDSAPVVNEPPPNYKLLTTNYKLTTKALAGARAKAKTPVDNFFVNSDYLETLRFLRPELEPKVEIIKGTFIVHHREKQSMRNDWPKVWERWVLCERDGDWPSH